jgi:hypothetical protein
MAIPLHLYEILENHTSTILTTVNTIYPLQEYRNPTAITDGKHSLLNYLTIVKVVMHLLQYVCIRYTNIACTLFSNPLSDTFLHN